MYVIKLHKNYTKYSIMNVFVKSFRFNCRENNSSDIHNTYFIYNK